MNKERGYNTGAYRDTDENKLDYEGAISPIALERYVKYLHSHRKQSDGRMRNSDNWQQGMPRSVYMKSAWRHFMDCWKAHRGCKIEYTLEDALCAVLFNIFGYLHELLSKRDVADKKKKKKGKS